MKIEDYFKAGLLRKEKIDRNQIDGSLELAARFLDRAKGNVKIEYFDVAFTLAYNSMFHSARALLFSFGVKERSHFAMIEFLKEKFKDSEKIFQFLNILDSYRISRHAVQYKGAFCSRLDAEEAIKDAENFLKVVKKYLNKHLNKKKK